MSASYTIETLLNKLRAEGISENIIEAFRRVARESFLPDNLKDKAYENIALPIEEGQSISQPSMIAVMLQLLDPKPENKVLEVGTGSGYEAALLSCLAQKVITIERKPILAASAEARLRQLGYTNVRVITGDGSLGLREEAPFDRIIVSCGAPNIPNALTDQLADNGRLVIPVGSRTSQLVKTVTKKDNKLFTESSNPCIFVPLIGEQGWPRE